MQATTPRLRRCSLPSVSLDVTDVMELVPYPLSLYLVHPILMYTETDPFSFCAELDRIHRNSHREHPTSPLKRELCQNFDSENTSQLMLTLKRMP